MSDALLLIVFSAFGYLLGALPTGYVVARRRGVDIRSVGSGSIGATNVLRSLGPLPALFVAVIDPLKGVAAAGLPALLGLSPWIMAAGGFAAVLGNTVNVLLGWRGGKGVATAFGVMLVVAPYVALLAAALFAVTLWAGRYVSLASMVAVCVGTLLMVARPGVPLPHMLLGVVLAGLVVWRHRSNIARLRTRTESRLGRRPVPSHQRGPQEEGPPSPPPPPA